MLNKVLNNLKKIEKKNGKDLSVSFGGLKAKVSHQDGFRPKENSQAGAERQRSMGNRMAKPSKAK